MSLCRRLRSYVPLEPQLLAVIARYEEAAERARELDMARGLDEIMEKFDNMQRGRQCTWQWSALAEAEYFRRIDEDFGEGGEDAPHLATERCVVAAFKAAPYAQTDFERHLVNMVTKQFLNKLFFLDVSWS